MRIAIPAAGGGGGKGSQGALRDDVPRPTVGRGYQYEHGGTSQDDTRESIVFF